MKSMQKERYAPLNENDLIFFSFQPHVDIALAKHFLLTFHEPPTRNFQYLLTYLAVQILSFLPYLYQNKLKQLIKH
jgi:hypothetical protein